MFTQIYIPPMWCQQKHRNQICRYARDTVYCLQERWISLGGMQACLTEQKEPKPEEDYCSRYHDTISRYHVTIPFRDIMSRYHFTTPSHDTISRHHVTILCHDTVSRHHATIPFRDIRSRHNRSRCVGQWKISQQLWKTQTWTVSYQLTNTPQVIGIRCSPFEGARPTSRSKHGKYRVDNHSDCVVPDCLYPAPLIGTIYEKTTDPRYRYHDLELWFSDTWACKRRLITTGQLFSRQILG